MLERRQTPLHQVPRRRMGRPRPRLPETVRVFSAGWFSGGAFVVADFGEAGNVQGSVRRLRPAKVAKYTAKDVERLMVTPGVVKNRAKILATITNAQKFLEVQ